MTRTSGSLRRAAYAASALAVAAALGLGAGEWLEARAQEPLTLQRLPNGAPMSFADLIERVSPAVVSVSVTTEIEYPSLDQFNFEGAPPAFEEFFRRFREEFGDELGPRPPEEGTSLGSGFVISPDGYIVTNNHVVANASEVTVTLKSGDELEAEIVGVDESTDLAVLKVSHDESLPFVEFATGDVRVGDWVVAVGNPFGLGGTATAGIISASGREIGGQYNDFIQIDAPINRGNSGGPTFDLNGRVVGVNSQIFSPSGGSVGIGFAIPAETASRVVSALISEGRVVRGWLGVTIGSVTPDIAAGLGLDEPKGAIVSDVMPGGPAEAAGFEAGDVVLAVEGEEVESNIDLTRKVGNLKVGERVRFRVLRDDRERTLTATIGERPSEDELASMREAPGARARPPRADGATENEEFGMALSALDQATRQRLDLEPDVQGVVVRDAARNGAAARKGIEAGDVILEVAGESVSTPAEFDAAIERARESGRPAVLVLIQTEEGRRFSTLPLTEEGDG